VVKPCPAEARMMGRGEHHGAGACGDVPELNLKAALPYRMGCCTGG
jgi:hypothetical protein